MVSAAGSALSAGALPLIAIVVLDAGPLGVSLLAVTGSVASALLALPLGTVIDRSDKRAVLVLTDLLALVALLSVPLAVLLGHLTFLQLCVVAAVATTCSIASTAAGFAYVKATVAVDRRVAANGRLDSVNWATNAAGPPLGGALISVAGPTITLLGDAASFLASALLLSRAPRSPAVAGSDRPPDRRRDLWAGWRLIAGNPGLRAFYLNALLFGGTYLWTVPLVAVLVLTDLNAPAFQYGLVLGIPSVGGFLGALLSPQINARLGTRRCLLIFGATRAVWLLPLPLLPANSAAIVILIASQFMLLLTAGVFNPVFTTYRMAVTPDTLMARVSTAWSVSSRSVQPLFITIGGVLAAWTSLRWSLAAAAVLCLGSGISLPWGRRHIDQI